ncbi:hypothetical protein SS50377_21166 [Spironucleus salmonicida]|uniref:Uncharacterized protein n=1 Tax=Spironucleus salmonicida TaxID=348837 RepID=V6LJQ1_9EUKA|nr:hypothetical protein SS50377_21166 [Spironucleus salmonicida]|eukprot:EST43946.1 Hypothetical protein SS50377_16249 [Spironucleus salmonicida]
MQQIKPQVLDYILTLDAKKETQKATNFQYNMTFILLGQENSGINEFYQYINQYINFDTKTTSAKYLTLNGEDKGRHLNVKLFNLQTKFSRHEVIKIAPLSALLFFHEDNIDSITFVMKVIDDIYNTIYTLNTSIRPKQTELKTLSNIADCIMLSEARPSLFVFSIRGNRTYKMQALELKKMILKKGFRLQEFQEYDAQSYQIILAQASSLAELYPVEFFEIWDKHTTNLKGCSGQ